MFDWNDVKALLAVARGGSTAAAARELGVNQTTVARRLEALERDLGAKLVERHQAGASLTEAGLSLVADAEAMERAALSLRRTLEAHHRGVTGSLRITMSEMTASAAFTPLLPEFREMYPDLLLEVVITDEMLDLEAGQADVAIRGAFALPDSNLVARKIGETQWTLYCSRDYARRVGLPTSPADLKDHTIIGGDGDPYGFPGLGDLLAKAPEAMVTLKSSSTTNLFASVRAGLGIGPMPTVLAGLETDLIEVFPPRPESRSYTWILTRPEIKDTARVRAFLDYFGPRIQAMGREAAERAAKMTRPDLAEISSPP